jgi:hypothetical protein
MILISSRGRTREPGLVSRLGQVTASQAGQNDGKELQQVITAGQRVGNGSYRALSAETCHSAIDPVPDITQSHQARRFR